MKFFFLVAVTFCFFQAPVHAQDFAAEFLAPPGPAKTTIRLHSSDSIDAGSNKADTDTTEQRVLIYIPIYKNETETYGINLKWDHIKIESKQLLPRSGVQVPNKLYDVMAGGTYKKELSETKSMAFNLSYGSASDDPFASGGSSTLSSTFSYTVVESPISRWVYILNYSNNRSFANNIPIPGFAYIYTPSKDLIGLFGLPFVFIRKAFTEDFAMSFFNLLTTYKIEASYKIKGPIQAYASIGSTTQSFFREGRLQDEDRLFYTERRSLIGIKSPISESIYADIYTGMISQRTMFEQEDFSLSPNDLISFDNRYIFGISLSGRF